VSQGNNLLECKDETSESSLVDAVVGRLESWIGSDVQKPNWDSYGANPVTTKTISMAIDLARLIVGRSIGGAVINSVVPANDGDIVFTDSDEVVWIKAG
jgi:hypothetical protein